MSQAGCQCWFMSGHIWVTGWEHGKGKVGVVLELSLKTFGSLCGPTELDLP